MRSKAAPPLAVLIVVFVYLSLFSHRIPEAIKGILFFVVLFLEIAMIAAGWRFCLKDGKATGVPDWRKRVALSGVVANTIAFAMPLLSLVYMIFYDSIARRAHLPMIDGDEMLLVSLLFSLCGLIAGFLSPGRSRFAIALGNVIIALLILAIPRAVL